MKNLLIAVLVFGPMALPLLSNATVIGEFFKPWKRKVGLVTLAWACVFTCGWLRSLVAPEFMDFLNDNDTFNRLVSVNGKIVWERFHQEGAKRLSREQLSTAKTVLDHDERRILEVKWTFLGFGRGRYRSESLDLLRTSNPLLPFESITQSVWTIPYWSIVVPLTALSSWLFLSKSRPSNSNAPGVPTPESAA